MTTVQDALDEYLMTIGGSATGAASGRTYESLDPYTGKPWARVPDAGVRGRGRRGGRGPRALDGPWGQLTATQRGKLLHRLGDLIAREAPRLAELETRDNGKLLREMAGQMAGLPEWYYYFAGLADKHQGSVIPSTRRTTSSTPATSRSGWWRPSSPGTPPCCCSPGSSRPRWPPAARWWSSRATTPR